MFLFWSVVYFLFHSYWMQKPIEYNLAFIKTTSSQSCFVFTSMYCLSTNSLREMAQTFDTLESHYTKRILKYSISYSKNEIRSLAKIRKLYLIEYISSNRYSHDTQYLYLRNTCIKCLLSYMVTKIYVMNLFDYPWIEFSHHEIFKI